MRTATFDNTVSILLKAYLNDELEHDNCAACAVGKWINLLARIRRTKFLDTDWIVAHKHINATGYSVHEIHQIEYAFENAPYQGDDTEEWMFNGLMAVVDVLAEIHGIDLTAKEEAKKLFVKI
jgi:hypothetical protein